MLFKNFTPASITWACHDWLHIDLTCDEGLFEKNVILTKRLDTFEVDFEMEKNTMKFII